jgi:dTDP-glucose pyrophosphorylase/predicted transcriptional regulator
MLNNWRKTILNPISSISDAIYTLNKYGLGIILVTNDDHQLIGTITDGDIRRALIKHTSLNTSILNIMCKKPLTAHYKTKNNELLKIFSEHSIMQIPLINENNKIVGVKTLQSFLSRKKNDNPVFIMAGGFGKRLIPLTENIPKPMLKIGGQPILEKIIKKFIDAGFYNFYISTFYKSHVIKEYFQNGSDWNVSIKYIEESKPLGTAGALSLLPYKNFKSPIIMINGDLITDLDINNIIYYHNQEQNVITIGAKKYEIEVPYGVIETKEKNQVTSIVEKPKQNFFINAGIYVIEPNIIKKLDRDKLIDMPNWINKIVADKYKISIFPIFEDWVDIGDRNEF